MEEESPEKLSLDRGTSKGKGIVRLFGVDIRTHSSSSPVVEEDEDYSIQRSYSLNNLKDLYDHQQDDHNINIAGYLSDEPRDRSHVPRKKGKPWSEEEHKKFLAGLEQLGKGDWKGIAKKFVTTRTPTQVASHAQKYFNRQNSTEKRKHRPSVFDITLTSSSTVNPEPIELPININPAAVAATYQSAATTSSILRLANNGATLSAEAAALGPPLITNHFRNLCLNSAPFPPPQVAFVNYPNNPFMNMASASRPGYYPHANPQFMYMVSYAGIGAAAMSSNNRILHATSPPVVQHPSGIPSPEARALLEHGSIGS